VRVLSDIRVPRCAITSHASLTKCRCFTLRRLSKPCDLDTDAYDMQIARAVVLVGLSIILSFEVFPEKSIWSISVKEGDEHIIAVPAYPYSR